MSLRTISNRKFFCRYCGSTNISYRILLIDGLPHIACNKCSELIDIQNCNHIFVNVPQEIKPNPVIKPAVYFKFVSELKR
jgi:RNA polymerase subunit RPABC4/transcription elongation factor Spt4